ncbi:hypothetical protein SAMN05444344_1776 [Tenacibaculum mesophilum]|uniref:DUF4870 domain-containing protein n=1 Tax=Tenacibaculum mesophilum TaxID=104268 RepID=A0ABM7CDW7_9FLAO|nr:MULTISPECIES: DUF4870 domain-containing protein [Tenacibaculum]GFD82709.1 hypothetical protein KUL118_55710 [Tenacibaculum sp. KUL118]AZJ31932.1 DUF4870 domain-containing protein [Tenacibaculum mesophilum]MCO7184782.1 DUF4870 domain-containing protein [Tenacibaculum sp. XPcli2-G]QFS27189.1 DUF4870 domain-containing protein [Tenacibaculum mesophilum]SHF86776.1 hypothetical protein SAMN05444344_1776 [Tenacibaculum mesophilum]
MQHNNQNTNAFLIHISAFAGYLFPLGSIITPLILWQTLKERSTFLDEHGKEAVNFNISYSLYIFILGLSFIPFFFGRIFNGFDGIDIDFGGHHGHGGLFGIFGFASVVSIVALIKVALIIIAAMKANKGEMYKYPLTIKFIK